MAIFIYIKTMTTKTILLFIAAVSTSLIGGVFYAFTCAVLPGLGRLSDQAYLSAMQAINRAIQNPLFFATFMGTLFLLPTATYLHYTQAGLSGRFFWLLAGTVLYAAGVFGITVFGNVPLNEWLDKIDLSAMDSGQMAEIRRRYEGPWNSLHTIRTFASAIVIALVTLACLSLND
jgi:uncharacterized membrane protein